MVSATVRAEGERQLVVHSVGEWRPGAESVNFHAAMMRGSLCPVKVKLVSRDRRRVFVKFDSGCTAWVLVDELQEG